MVRSGEGTLLESLVIKHNKSLANWEKMLFFLASRLTLATVETSKRTDCQTLMRVLY